MVRKLIEWAVANPLVVLLLAAVLLVGGGYAFFHVNIEAYPDPAPAIIEVVAQFPGASAEEVERLVTVPLETALAGMPGLESTRSKSLFGLAHLRNQFTYARDYDQARQDVINRLANVSLPAGVTPQISPASPIGEVLRYVLVNPRNALGQPIYTLNDLKALQDYTIQRALLRVPRIAGVTAAGGTVKRYEIQPDPVRLSQYGVTLAQLQAALAAANGNGSGDNLTQGPNNTVVRTIGLYGRGQDPMQLQEVLAGTDPVKAARILRAEEARRVREIRQTVVASTNNVPVRVDQLVDGGPLLNSDGTSKEKDDRLIERGVVVGHQTRQGRVGISRPIQGEDGELTWTDEDDVVHGVVLLRKGQESLPALRDLLEKIDELNQPGRLLPGVKIAPYYNRTDLINRTTETVHENLLAGMALVVVILLMFLSNVRVALIVAINIPLALLFAFTVLFVRNRSANLLSIGAVDFGIIVDSTVIMVESIYRKLAAGENPDKPLTMRIVMACAEVERSLFFATIIMVCALLPLFTMKGPEGQIFGPMADTYAFALGGALLLALTVSPVLCLLALKTVKPARDNLLVRAIKAVFLWQLTFTLRHRWLAIGMCIAGLAATGYVVSGMGREFMPELEEGNVFIRGTFPVNVSLDEAALRTRVMRRLLQQFPEVEAIVPMIGRPDDGTDPTGYYNVEANMPMRPEITWPIDPSRRRPRTKPELIDDLGALLRRELPGIDWDFSQVIRDNVMEALSGVKGENSVKIFGPDLGRLEELAYQVRDVLNKVPGVENPGVFRIQGQSTLEFHIDRDRCARWNVAVADVQNVIQTAVGGKAATQMIEGGKTFDVTLRWPRALRADEQAILAIPVNVGNNQVTAGSQTTLATTPIAGGSVGLSPTGTTVALPAPTGTAVNAPNLAAGAPVRPLRDLVVPVDTEGQSDASGSYLRPGASTIYREGGHRLIAIKFKVGSKAPGEPPDLAGTVAEAQRRVLPLLPVPYRSEWSGEFQEMEEAESRLLKTFAVSLALIVVLLYLAFRSWLDAAVVLVNVLAVSVGGVWALWLAGLSLNISAAVGFISILGVAVMNGLILVSSFNALRAQGAPLEDALLQGVAKRIRPLIMTSLTAILGLLPAALSTRMGSQSQRPLAVVVVGGMLSTIVMMLLGLMPVLYSLYGRREPPAGAGELAH